MSLLAYARELVNRLLGHGRHPDFKKWPHYIPPVIGGPTRCFYCHAAKGSRAFAKPCTRRRPDYTELS